MATLTVTFSWLKCHFLINVENYFKKLLCLFSVPFLSTGPIMFLWFGSLLTKEWLFLVSRYSETILVLLQGGAGFWCGHDFFFKEVLADKKQEMETGKKMGGTGSFWGTFFKVILIHFTQLKRSALENGMRLSQWHRMHHSNAGKWLHVQTSQNFNRVNFLDKAIQLQSWWHKTERLRLATKGSLHTKNWSSSLTKNVPQK